MNVDNIFSFASGISAERTLSFQYNSSNGLLFSFLQVSIFCGCLFGDYFANQVASTKILVIVAPKVVAAWGVALRGAVNNIMLLLSFVLLWNTCELKHSFLKSLSKTCENYFLPLSPIDFCICLVLQTPSSPTVHEVFSSPVTSSSGARRNLMVNFGSSPPAQNSQTVTHSPTTRQATARNAPTC